MSNHDLNAAAFLECVGALLDTSEVSSMKRWRHHFSITCYQHSLFVSYVAFRLARYFGWDYRAAARAGLLHDLYLYDPADGSAHPGNSVWTTRSSPCATPPPCAPTCPSGRRTPSSPTCSPLALHLPRCREALVVNVADKVCATLEVVHLYQTRRVQRWLPLSAA